MTNSDHDVEDDASCDCEAGESIVLTPNIPRLRGCVTSLPAYVPGKTVDHPQAAKLSSNENPNPPLVEVVAAMAAAAGRVNRYPDMSARALVSAIAKRHGIDPCKIVVGTGSSALLLHSLTAVAEPGCEVITAWRSFESYPIAIGQNGATHVKVPLTEDFRHDLDAINEAITGLTRAIILCSPNNPTGPGLEHEEVRQFLREVPPEVLVLLDQAYLEYTTDPAEVDGIELIDEFPNLVVLRTFSKAFSLAGARVGYAVAPRRVAAAIRAVATPFGVSEVAQAGAVVALEHEGQFMQQVRAGARERDRIRVALVRQGWNVADSQANFVWIAGAARVKEITDTCREAGIMVRPFPEGVRVSAGLPVENDRFLAVMATLVPPSAE